jgi:TonB family protein
MKQSDTDGKIEEFAEVSRRLRYRSRSTKLVLLSLLLVLTVAASGLGQTERSLSREELKAGVQMYDNGDYAGARFHFEAALRLDASNRKIHLLIARAIHRQYQPGVSTPENWAVGMEAVAAYERALGASSASTSESLHGGVQLLTDMGDNELATLWLLRLARAPQVPSLERSAAFAALAVKKLECVRSIDVAVAPGAERTLAHVWAGAQWCALDGLEYAKQALVLDPSNADAHKIQTTLQLEKQRLKQIANDIVARASLARATGQEVKGDGLREGDRLASQGDRNVPDLRQIAQEKGMKLNGLAIRKPEPVYPLEARKARVSGTVMVMVDTDEAGKVFSANAISGHYLLRQAAVVAAQHAQFSPTYDLNGQAIKIAYLMTYEFAAKDGP